MNPSPEICNKLIDVNDLEKPGWRGIIDEMHELMKVPERNRKSFCHCTDRRSLIHRAEIESYKHWEYPWTIVHGSFEPGMPVLDCGCGRGFLQIYLALKGCNVHSVDVSTMKTKDLRKFWNLVQKYKLPLKENRESAIKNLAKRYNTSINFKVASISRLPYENASFDRVYCISALEHMNPGEDEEAVREMCRVLKPGGRLLITVDFSPVSLPDRRSYNANDIVKMIKISGLELSGKLDYACADWRSHLAELEMHFLEKNAHVSSAAFVLLKR
ncbi:MAG: class I SAM-dependent methyltransferase [Elusimicrobia bacterium]|nr:class I SAM-dependent methyltransferase [Elusimicrobiota bacterium]